MILFVTHIKINISLSGAVFAPVDSKVHADFFIAFALGEPPVCTKVATRKRASEHQEA
jgi:hypothetical protein